MIRVQVLSEETSNDGRVVLDKSHEVPEKQLNSLNCPPQKIIQAQSKFSKEDMHLQAEITSKQVVEQAPIAVEAQANIPNNTAQHLLSDG